MNSISRTTKETEGTRKRTGVAAVTAAYDTSAVRGTSRSLQDEQRAGRTRLRPLPRALRTRTSDHVALSSGSVRVWGRSLDPAAWHRLSSRPGPCPPSSPPRGQRGAGPASPRALCLPRARRSEQCARSLGPPPTGPAPPADLNPQVTYMDIQVCEGLLQRAHLVNPVLPASQHRSGEFPSLSASPVPVTSTILAVSQLPHSRGI